MALEALRYSVNPVTDYQLYAVVELFKENSNLMRDYNLSSKKGLLVKYLIHDPSFPAITFT